MAANLHVRNDRPRLIDVATKRLPFIGYPRTRNALRAIEAAARQGYVVRALARDYNRRG